MGTQISCSSKINRHQKEQQLVLNNTLIEFMEPKEENFEIQDANQYKFSRQQFLRNSKTSILKTRSRDISQKKKSVKFSFNDITDIILITCDGSEFNLHQE